jgi:hypothetical protein
MLAAVMIAAAMTGCGNSYVEEVRCVPSEAGQCKHMEPDAFNDDKQCQDKATEVMAGPVLTTDPTITGRDAAGACCYLVKLDRAEGRLCLGSGRPLGIQGEVRFAELRRGGVAWA